MRLHLTGVKRSMTQVLADTSSDDVTNAGLYLFYQVLAGIGGLATLIVLVAVLTVLLKKLGLLDFIKLGGK